MAVRGQRAAGGRPFFGSPEAVFHDATHASYLVAASKNTEARAGHRAHAVLIDGSARVTRGCR
jgi:hypothetical protein